ncbi:hypothetical protein [Glycomyces buryatensis]|uniref:Uncharacterized protein n=1 Tax=Glycomyces buryatensis TaxID=2570927 RepID=A0A4S8Q394_9ACTN|nr:hypothetical protein [Glycomyces buryatensis]THV37012.1 hypothetical protein FAB82_20880 [Glycomyces buryatensis]
MRRLSYFVIAMVSAIALLWPTAASASADTEGEFAAQTVASGPTTTEAGSNGRNVTVARLRSKSDLLSSTISCPEGSFCIELGGKLHVFPTCTLIELTSWEGTALITNNISGTVTRAYDANGHLVWSKMAKFSISVNITPWSYIRTC